MNYWDSFYINFRENKPSDFAKFVFDLNIIDKNDKIIDIGCGTGRDTKFFQRHFDASGIDCAEISDFKYIKSDISDVIKDKCLYDVVYSRFFFHSITPELTQKIIEWSKKWLVAEFRVKEDVPTLFVNHKRYLVDPDWFKSVLERTHDIQYFEISRGWSKYKNEDPILARVIAKRRSRV